MLRYWLNNLIIFIVFCFAVLLYPASLSAESVPQLKWLYTIDGYGDHDFFQEPQGIWFDSIHNELLIADTGNNSIGIFDSNGRLIFRFGAKRRVSSPMSVVTDSSGNIYWSEINTLKVKKDDFRGEPIQEFNFSQYTEGQNVIVPGKLYIDKSGNLYMIDRGNGQVVKLNSKGNFISILNGMKDSHLQGEQFADLEITKDSTLYLLSHVGTAVYVFDSQNHLIRNFGEHGNLDMNVSFPTGLAIGPKGRIWIVDNFQNRLKVFSPEGEYLFQLGVTGKGDGQFYFPVDLTFDDQNHLYVLEKGTNRVQVFEVLE